MEDFDRKVARILSDGAENAVNHIPSMDLAGCESPIERLMLLAFWSRGVWTGRLVIEPYSRTLEILADLATDRFRPSLGIQVAMGPYRADFAIVERLSGDEPPLIVVVECDGHDFHERTREQAKRDKARDRWMVENGITVMRFTGSEIWNKAGDCAEQVIQFIERSWMQSVDRNQERRQKQKAAQSARPHQADHGRAR